MVFLEWCGGGGSCFVVVGGGGGAGGGPFWGLFWSILGRSGLFGALFAIFGPFVRSGANLGTPYPLFIPPPRKEKLTFLKKKNPHVQIKLKIKNQNFIFYKKNNENIFFISSRGKKMEKGVN